MRILPRMALMVAATFSGVTVAAPCAGFPDVDDSDLFCPSVEWMKNREVTTGCPGMLYCPLIPVSRLQMAAFLNRFANALTPVYLGSNLSWSANNGNLTPGVITCPAGTYTPTFPGRAHGFAMASATATTNADVDVALEFVVSTNNGPYQAASPRQIVTTSGAPVSTARSTSVAVMLPPTDLAPGTAYGFALRLIRPAGSATTADASGACQVHVLIENRNPPTSPLDDADDGGG